MLVKTCAMTNTMRQWFAQRTHRCYCNRNNNNNMNNKYLYTHTHNNGAKGVKYWPELEQVSLDGEHCYLQINGFLFKVFYTFLSSICFPGKVNAFLCSFFNYTLAEFLLNIHRKIRNLKSLFIINL